MFIDIGVNFTNSQFQHDLAEVIQRAHDANVSELIITGTSIPESIEALKLANQYPHCYATAGIHPHDSGQAPDDFETLIKDLAANEQVVAIGECGLDFNRDYSPRADQERVFASHLHIAKEVDKPLFMHQRDANQRFVDIFTECLPNGHDGVLHCFTDNLAALRQTLDLGLYIGITGWICDERRGLELREILQYIPVDRLLLETDSPFLLPRDLKPKPKKRRNEPMHLPHIANTVAEILSTDVNALARQVLHNTQTLFGIDK